LSTSKILRPYQEALLCSVFDAIAAGWRRIMVQAPTGAGKTIIAATAVKQHIDDLGGRVIFVAPAISLIDQTVERFRGEGIDDIGVIQADHILTNPAACVQIASAQTLLHRPIPPADFVMIDEAHRWYDFYGEWMQKAEWLDVPFIGLSATPWTRGLGLHYEKLIVATTTAELIAADFLTKFRAYAPSAPDLSGVRTVAGDYHEGDLARVMDHQTLVGDVVGEWVKRGEGRPTFCFAVTRAHADHLAQRFEAAGIHAAYVDAATSFDERDEIKRAFHSGEIKVVCNVGVLTTGIDWDVRCIILARPTKSEILFVQIIGRGLRTADGKDDLLILDHAGNHARLGFVTDIHHEILDDGAPKAKQGPRDNLPNECSMCAYIKPRDVRKCPACGFAPPQQMPVCLPGNLNEIQQPTHDERIIQFYRELKGYAEIKGFRSGWVAHKFKDKFGNWPPRSFTAFPGAAPSPAVSNWIREMARAYYNSGAA
jgi:DNA repair protein RadD